MIISLIVSFLNLVLKALGGVASAILFIFPTSPFLLLSEVDIPFLDTLNWVIPFNMLVSILGYVAFAFVTFYIISTVARWIKMIA